jgi:hypothetical protein
MAVFGFVLAFAVYSSDIVKREENVELELRVLHEFINEL